MDSEPCGAIICIILHPRLQTQRYFPGILCTNKTPQLQSAIGALLDLQSTTLSMAKEGFLLA